MKRKELEKPATKEDIFEALEGITNHLFNKVKGYFGRIFSLIKKQNRNIRMLEKELVASQLRQEELEERLNDLENQLSHKKHIN